MNTTGRAAVAVLLALAGLLPGAEADDWPQWLGPQRDGVWREKDILTNFPVGGPPVLWRAPLQGGYSGAAVVGDRLYVMDRQAGKPLERKPGEKGLPELPGTERVLCLDATHGKTIWEHSYERAYRIDYPSGPRCMPIVHEGKIYTLGAMGDLRCLDAQTGKILWSHRFLEDYQLKEPPLWGWAAHPLVVEDKVICLVGGEGTAVVAFHKDTGRELWRALTTKEICYAPPILAPAAGHRQLIVWHSEAITGLDPETGQTYWSLPYPPEGKPMRPEVLVATPRWAGDHLFLNSYYHGAMMLRLTGDKPGAEVAWIKKSTSKSSFNAGLHTVMCTPVIKNGFIYGVCGLGELRCLDAQTGERRWETYAATGGKRGLFANAFLIEHADQFFIWNDQGELLLVRLSPEGLSEIGRAKLLDTSENARGRDVVWCPPAFANRRVYVRNTKELICVSLEERVIK